MDFPQCSWAFTYDIRCVIKPHDVLITQGVEPHPGPSPGVPSGEGVVGASVAQDIFTIDFINCTHAWEHAHDLACRNAQAIFFCEHSCNPSNIGLCKQAWKGYGWTGILSELDPELKHLTGGVGGMVRDPCRIFTMPPISSKLQSLIHNGRLGLYGCDIGGSQHAVVFVCYGWTGGHQDDWAANRTDGLMEVILDEVQLRSPSQPILLVGDFNCTPDRLPHLQALINDFSFVDFGAKASFWGGQDNQDTCFSHNTTAGSRSDFVLCNAAMVPFVHRFEVQKDEAFPVHHVLRLSLHALGPSRWNNVNKLPPSMEALISQIFEDSIMDEDLSNKDRTAKWNLFLESFQNCVSKHLISPRGPSRVFARVATPTAPFCVGPNLLKLLLLNFVVFPLRPNPCI